MLDVAIIGAGPVGSRIAFKLSGMGYKVAVLEKRSGIGQKPCCTGIISRECLIHFSIPSSVTLRHVKSAKIVSPAGNSVNLYHPEPLAYVIDRSAFDNILAEKAQSQGAAYYLNSKVENIFCIDDRVLLEVDCGSSSRKIEAQAAVLASGFYSPLVKKLHIAQPEYFVAGAQAEVELNNVNEIEIHFNQKLAPGFFGWIVPTSPGLGLVGLLSRVTPGGKLRKWISELEACDKITRRKYTVRYGGISFKPIAKTYGKRFLLVGDVAGQAKPTTGGGIYFGLLCADIAAGTMHNSLTSGNLSAKSLSCYQRNWKRKLGKELQMEYFARRVYERLNNNQIERIIARLNSGSLIDSLMHNSEISFDFHGNLLMKTLRSLASQQLNKWLQNIRFMT